MKTTCIPATMTGRSTRPKHRHLLRHLAFMSLFLVCAGVSLAGPELLAPDGRVGWSIAAIDDFNADGQDDLVWSDGSDLEIDLMDGAAVLATSSVTGEPGYQLAGSGDVTGDGVADLLWYQRGTGLRVYVMAAGGTDSNEHPDLPLPAGTPADAWEVAAAGDFDADGDADLLWRNQPGPESGTGRNEAYLLDYTDPGLNFAAVYVRTIAGQKWRVVGAGDLDADGHDDLVWQKSSLSASAAVNTERFFLVAGELDSSLKLLWTPGENWAVRGAADFRGDGNADLILRNEITQPNNYKAWLLELEPDSSGDPAISRSSRYDALVFENPIYDLAGLGDLDGDGNADTVWRDEAADESWVWFTDRMQAVHFKPRTTWGDQQGNFSTQWLLALVENGQVNEPHLLEVESELVAIKNKTGLRQVKIELGVGKTFTFPDPELDQLASVVEFFKLLEKHNMTATMNIANNCWVPDILLKDDALNPTPRLHVAGHAKGECYQSKRNQPCGPSCSEPGCTRMKWDMALDGCREDPFTGDDTDYTVDQGWITDSRHYYDTILGYLVTNVPDVRKRIMFFNINGSAVETSPSEPGMFNPNMWGPPDPAPGDPYFALQEVVRRYYLAVYDVARGYPIPIGMKSNPNKHDDRLKNVRLALGDVVEEIDFWDFTSGLTIDVDEILADLELPEDRLSTMALTDFAVPNNIPSDEDLANHMQCFFDEIQERGLLGWWFNTFRAGFFAGLLNSDSPIGAPEGDPETVWQEAAVDAVRHDLHYFDGSPGTCSTPIPQPQE